MQWFPTSFLEPPTLHILHVSLIKHTGHQHISWDYKTWQETCKMCSVGSAAETWLGTTGLADRCASNTILPLNIYKTKTYQWCLAEIWVSGSVHHSQTLPVPQYNLTRQESCLSLETEENKVQKNLWGHQQCIPLFWNLNASNLKTLQFMLKTTIIGALLPLPARAPDWD